MLNGIALLVEVALDVYLFAADRRVDLSLPLNMAKNKRALVQLSTEPAFTARAISLIAVYEFSFA